MKRLLCLLLLVSLLLPLATGCDTPASQAAAKRQKQKQDYENRKILTPKNHPRPTASKQRTPKPTTTDDTDPLDTIARSFDASQSRLRPTVGRGEDVSIRKITTAIHASLELGPTLVIWVVDRTSSSQKIVLSAVESARKWYDSTEAKAALGTADQKLLTAIVAYDETAEFLLDPPSADGQAVKAAFDKIQPSGSGREKTFTTLQQTLEKYLPLRTTGGREVVLVVLTDEAGDDANLADDVIDMTRRAALPIYVIGSPAPWGQASPGAADPKKADLTKTDDSAPVHGPESVASERVDIEMIRISYGYNPGNPSDLSLIDSGFGPFALERLCRASGGQFFIVRPERGSNYTFRGTTYTYWPSGNEVGFTLENLSKYAPDYVSPAEYQKLLAENPARQAVHNAAQLPKLVIDETPTLNFPRNDRTTEAKMKQNLDRAQQYAAKWGPKIDPFYATLIPGEAGRDKLTSPRWQAAYDLAMGRVLACKVRIDGYNSMIAALKRGKTFANPGSTQWILEPADVFETESTLKKMGERAKMYLERVKTEHVGTPWAKIAEEELKSPLGWTWKEA
ncbi:MAG: vWA domain-containing protein [Pirellulaceae bacterium]|nr:vWA domain-containing protein [Pirellulaceae bacterium]